MSDFGTLTCGEPGCDRTTPGLLGIAWTCPAHSGPPVWPAAHEPCSDDTDCGTSCYREDDGTWVYETTRGGNGYALEDVQAFCRCEHHQAATARELARGIGYLPARLPGAWWNLDPLAVRHHEARRAANAMRSRAFAMHRMGPTFPNNMHPGTVQAIGQTPVVAGDSRYVSAWNDERDRGCPAWPKP